MACQKLNLWHATVKSQHDQLRNDYKTIQYYTIAPRVQFFEYFSKTFFDLSSFFVIFYDSYKKYIFTYPCGRPFIGSLETFELIELFPIGRGLVRPDELSHGT